MIPRLTHVELHELRTVTTDKTLPARYRAELSDWLDRYDELRQELVRARTELASRKAAIRTVEAEVRARVIAASAGRTTRQTERTVASDLDKAHRAVTDAERYLAIVDQATNVAATHLRERLPAEHLWELVQWIAKQRVELDWWSEPSGMVATVWGWIPGHVAIELPLDAWQIEPGVFTPQPLRLVLDLREVPSELVHRVVFAWSAISAGSYEITDSGRLRVTADWSSKPAEPVRPALRTRRRTFGFSAL